MALRTTLSGGGEAECRSAPVDLGQQRQSGRDGASRPRGRPRVTPHDVRDARIVGAGHLLHFLNRICRDTSAPVEARGASARHGFRHEFPINSHPVRMDASIPALKEPHKERGEPFRYLTGHSPPVRQPTDKLAVSSTRDSHRDPSKSGAPWPPAYAPNVAEVSSSYAMVQLSRNQGGPTTKVL